MPDGDGPTPIDGGEGRRARTSFFGLVAIVMTTLLVTLGANGARAGATSPTTTGAPHLSGDPSRSALPFTEPLTLLDQSAWVSKGQSFDLHLGVSNPQGLALSVAVFPCLTSISAFDQSLGTNGPVGSPVWETNGGVSVTALPVLPGGGVDLSMPVATTYAGPDPSPLTIQLTDGGNECPAFPSGVFPVRVRLVRSSTNTVLSSITTDLVFADLSPHTQRLRVAVVLPMATTQTATSATPTARVVARPMSVLQPPALGQVAAITSVLQFVDHSDVPVTVTTSGQTIVNSAIDSTAFTDLGSTHQLLVPSYVPIDASALVDSGLGAELTAQVQRATTIATSLTNPRSDPADHPDTTPAPSGTGATTSPSTWISGQPLDAGGVSALAGLGTTRLVLPSTGIANAPTNGSTAEPFTLVTRAGTVTVVAASADLTARFTDAPDNPVLAAHHLVAELAQLYFEKPNDVTVRGVVAEAPTTWTPSPAFVQALLGALQGNPMLEPVTTDTLMSSLRTAENCHESCRLSAATTPAVPGGAIRSVRQNLDEFASAAPAARTTSGELSDLLLSSQSNLLRLSEQLGVVRATSRALDAQLSQLVVSPGEHTVTLTAQHGRIPVTIVSSAPWPVSSTVTFSAEKLLFANGTDSLTESLTLLPQHTNVVYLNVATRQAGTFPVEVDLRSPDGVLLLASGQVTVRSTIFSFVGIALTLGALAVLAWWWVRTAMGKRRRARSSATP